MGRSRYRICEINQPYFLTCTVVEWMPLFAQPWIVHVVLESLEFLQCERCLILYAYVIMENHLHLIAGSTDLAKDVGHFKSFTARQIIDQLQGSGANAVLRRLTRSKRRHKRDRRYQFWQKGSHPILIQGVKMMRQKIEYIHNNPAERGYVDHPTDWRYSSARNYAGREGLIRVTTEW